MATSFQGTSINNAIDLRISFILKGKTVGSLNAGAADNLTCSFDSIGLGSSAPLTIFMEDKEEVRTITSQYVASAERLSPSKVAINYATPNSQQQRIIYTRQD
jgi:hypothetical protein